MNRLKRWWQETFIIPFRWQVIHRSWVWEYQENSVTGARRAVRVRGGYTPINEDWLNGRGPAQFEGRPPNFGDEQINIRHGRSQRPEGY